MADIILKDKNGNPVTYKGITELTFPTADGGIHTFGSSGWTAEPVKINGGYFSPSVKQMTVSHGLGAVPDFIFVGMLDVDDVIDRNGGEVAWSFGWSRRMMELENFSGYGALTTVRIDESDGEGNVNRGKYSVSEGIDESHPYSYGEIREANSYTFTVGIDEANIVCSGLHTRADYFWFAVSGLGTRMNQSSGV